MARLGIFGGSFDPVHLGHLGVAEHCRAHAGLEEVWFVPAASQPHKPRGPIASDKDRCAMLDRALAEEDSFRVSRSEIDRGGISFTADTLREVGHQRPDDSLFLILGADALVDLPTWREPIQICSLATLLVVDRPGIPTSAAEQRASEPSLRDILRIQHVLMPESEINSTQIRQRVRRGDAIDSLVSPVVARYIEDRRLYLV